MTMTGIGYPELRFDRTKERLLNDQVILAPVIEEIFLQNGYMRRRAGAGPLLHVFNRGGRDIRTVTRVNPSFRA